MQRKGQPIIFFCSSFRLSTMRRQEIENFLHFCSSAIVAELLTNEMARVSETFLKYISFVCS